MIMHRWFGEILVGFLAGAVLAAVIVSSQSVRHVVGFLLMVVVMYAFIRYPLGFLCGLFFIRPLLDKFLISVRIVLPGLDLGLGGIVALGLSVGTFLWVLTSPQDTARLAQKIVWLYVVFFLVCVSAWGLSPEKARAVKVLNGYASVLSILVLVLLHVRKESQARRVLQCMQYAPILPLLIGFGAYVTHGGRLAATFTHPNILAFFLLIAMGMLFFQLDQNKALRGASLWQISFLWVLAVSLLLTQTRSGWAAGLLMVGIYVLVFNRRWLIPTVAIIALLAMLPWVQEHLLNVVSVYGDRMSVNEQSSLGWRLSTWSDLIGQAIHRPLFGYGLQADYHMVEEGLAAHNDYLRWFIEAGLIGVLAYFGPYLYVLLHVISHRAQFPRGSILVQLCGFLICFIPAFLLMSVTENLASYITIHWYFWGLIGIYFALQVPQPKPACATVFTKASVAYPPIIKARHL